jgi:hypothetical protein
MEGLYAMNECRSVLLLENIRANFDDVIGPYPKEVAIECAMMQGAQREPIPDHGFPSRMCIRNNVRGVQQLLVAEVAERTLTPVGFEHPFSECSLMDSDSGDSGDVDAPGIFAFPDLGVHGRYRFEMFHVINSDCEDQAAWIICNNEHRPSSNIFARHEPVEIDEWNTPDHRGSESDVIRMEGIGAPVTIMEQVLPGEPVIISPRYRRDRQGRCSHDPRLEYALRAEEGNAFTIKNKARG